MIDFGLLLIKLLCNIIYTSSYSPLATKIAQGAFQTVVNGEVNVKCAAHAFFFNSFYIYFFSYGGLKYTSPIGTFLVFT